MRILFSLLFCINLCYGQINKIDSLKNELKKTSINVEILSLIGLEYSKSNKDSFKYYANYANAIAKSSCDKSFSLNALAGYSVINSKIDSAIYYYTEANKNVVNCKNKKQEAQILINWAFVNILIGNNDSTILLTTNAIQILKEQPSNENINKLLCKALKYKGDAYTRLGQYDKATEFLFEAKAINKNNDLNVEALVNGSLGSLYQSKLETDKAIKFFKLSIINFEKIGDVVNTELQLSNLANAFIENKNYDSASNYLKKCEPLLVKIKNPVKNAYVNKCWARIYLAKEQYNEAQIYYDKAIENYTEAGDNVLIADCYYGKAELYAKQNNYTKAKEYFIKTEMLFIENEQPNELSGLYYDLSKLENKNNDYKSAYAHLIQSYDLEDSLRAEKIIEVEKNAEQKYEASIKDLKINNQTLTIKNKNKNIALIAIIASVLGSLLFVGFYFYKKLNKQKNKIQQQRQEILHNNRNNIQQLISIFSRQSETVAIKENSIANQERLYTLNLLNKLLYENGQSNNASVKDYLTQLGEAKEISSGKVVSIQINTPSIILPSNLLKDIGLIINELTTNSIKYAFINIENQLIKIDVTQQENYLNLNIADNGNGLPKDFDINNSRQSFGLDFVKDLVEQHHGTIKAFNNRGACFEMRLKM